MEPRSDNETLYNEVLGITNNFLYPSNNKMYGKEPRDLFIANKSCSPLALRYIEVPLYNKTLLLQTHFVSPVGPLIYRGSTG